MKYFLFIVFLASVSVPAQYTKNDRQLAAAAFTRNFDKVTATEYLTSDDDKKVAAGLLSVSHSEDTNYVPIIISLPINKFARDICFTLGQLGYCNKSVGYLQKVFNEGNTDPLIKYYALVALGKIADSTYAADLITDYNNAGSKSEYNGISLALYYLCSGGKVSADKVRPVLETELYFSSSRQFEAAFCLYRIGPSKDEKDLLVKTLERILDGKVISPVTVKPVPYLLSCLRKLNYFPEDISLIEKIKKLNNFNALVETVRAFSYYRFRTREELDLYLDFLDSDNKNISRQAASSIKNMNLDTVLKDYLFLKLSERLHKDTDMEKYTQGELLLSYLTLFPEDFNDVFLRFFTDHISAGYLYRICAFYPGSEEALKILREKYYTADLAEKLTILESILNFDQDIKAVSDVLLSALSSDRSSLVSIASDGIDSSFISSEADTLSEIITSQVSNNLNNTDFIEGLMSLEKLSQRISEALNMKIRSYLSASTLYSIRKFTAGLKGESIHSISKDIDDFDNYWNNAFKFTGAEVVTEKGSFTISFLPGYAPVTVGSFCYLAGKNFFNGIPFHRVVPGFVIQGGDPTGTGWGGPGYEIVSEYSPLEYNEGMVGMASAGKDTEGSQWFITTGSYPHLNGRYTIFAEVLDGIDVVENITQGTKILKVNLIR